MPHMREYAYEYTNGYTHDDDYPIMHLNIPKDTYIHISMYTLIFIHIQWFGEVPVVQFQ